MEGEKIEELKSFVEHCRRDPSVLLSSDLSFFRDFLLRFDVEIRSEYILLNCKNLVQVDAAAADIFDSDIELDNSDVVESDNDPPQKMGDVSIEVTDEMIEAAQLSKAKAMELIAEAKYGEAVDVLTEAILLNPRSSILYANRASVFVKLKKPNAAIRDADFSLKLNPDSAVGYKARGMSKALLGSWEEAASDLYSASRLDFDEEIHSVLKKVKENARKLIEHRQKRERLRKEKELEEKIKKQHKQESESKLKKKPEPVPPFRDGDVILIRSARDMKTKLTAASDASRLAVIYFTAAWCGPCRYISPEYTALAKKFPGVVFLKVDIDEAVDAAAEKNISTVPTFLFVKNGKEVDQLVGGSKQVLEATVTRHAG
ncbi:hypothetical protein M569_07812, partial [Genlisea aurea]